MKTDGEIGQDVAAVRRFNRLYTRKIGVLGEGLLKSPYTLTEVRVLYELSGRDAATAAVLARELGLDGGYLSRILKAFQEKGLLRRRASADDGRQSLLSLTARGRKTFSALDTRSNDEVSALLLPLSVEKRRRLVAAMETIGGLLGPPEVGTAPYLLRPPRSGDMGWVVYRHGALYADEYGWDERFEALVAGIVAAFAKRHDPRRERCWIAERDGQPVGSVFLVKRAATIAQLRLLLVEPEARGLGIGERLVEECLRFARQTGYRKITLWTNDRLLAARRIYEKAGFHLTGTERHEDWGRPETNETWEKKL